MKVAVLLVIVLTFSLAFAQETSELAIPPNGDAERAEVSQWIGPVKISIAYHSPRVHNPATNDRTGHIWGELVHYGFVDEGFGPTQSAPWRAGANESTTITLSDDVKVDGKDLKAGTYALFLDLEKTGPSFWIFSRHQGWGSFQYDRSTMCFGCPPIQKMHPSRNFSLTASTSVVPTQPRRFCGGRRNGFP